RVADFLLAWHNAGENGGWDPSDLWAVDTAIADDMMTVLGLIHGGPVGKYPNDWGYRQEIEAIWDEWRRPRVDARKLQEAGQAERSRLRVQPAESLRTTAELGRQPNATPQACDRAALARAEFARRAREMPEN